jgi:hypothetical protein
MPTPPSRFKPPESFTTEDHVRSMRGEKIENEDFLAYKRDALDAAGLTDDDVELEPAEMTAQQHYAKQQQR